MLGGQKKAALAARAAMKTVEPAPGLPDTTAAAPGKPRTRAAMKSSEPAPSQPDPTKAASIDTEPELRSLRIVKRSTPPEHYVMGKLRGATKDVYICGFSKNHVPNYEKCAAWAVEQIKKSNLDKASAKQLRDKVYESGGACAEA